MVVTPNEQWADVTVQPGFKRCGSLLSHADVLNKISIIGSAWNVLISNKAYYFEPFQEMIH